jgi:soluble lytic murein transglycosylase-like protein
MRSLPAAVLLALLGLGSRLVAAGTLDPARLGECLGSAASRYEVSEQLLYAIALVESGLDPGAVHLNPDGSRDIGLMQVNSRWLPVLARAGIAEEHLYDPCVSLWVGAWVLADNIRRHGATWKAVGAYNATSAKKQRAYVRKLRKALTALLGEGALG